MLLLIIHFFVNNLKKSVPFLFYFSLYILINVTFMTFININDRFILYFNKFKFKFIYFFIFYIIHYRYLYLSTLTLDLFRFRLIKNMLG